MFSDSSDSNAKTLIARAALLVLVGGSMGVASNLFRKEGLHPGRFEAPVACDGSEPESGPVEIDAKEAATFCGRDDVVIADARPAERYAEGHIAGATHLPCTASGPLAEDALSHFASARMIIVYGQNTAEAVPVAASLRRREHGDVRVLKDGFSGWEKAGLACASGPCDDCQVPAPTPPPK